MAPGPHAQAVGGGVSTRVPPFRSSAAPVPERISEYDLAHRHAAMRLTSYEDRMLGNGLAAGLSFASIARDICERRQARSRAARKLAAIRWGGR